MSIDVELYAKNVTGAEEVFPLVINKFDEDYLRFGSRNISPLQLDTINNDVRARYRLEPGECLSIGEYWDQEYKGYSYYQSSEGESKHDQSDRLKLIIISQPRLTISGSPKHLDGLVKPLNSKKKVWGLVIE